MKPEGRILPPGAETWIVGLALVLFLALNLWTINSGHPVGGDFAHYIKHAQNLLSGQAYGSGVFMPGVSAHNYPPGFPLLIAPILAWAGPDMALLKLPAVFIWPLCAWLLALIARRSLGGETALLVFLFMLFAPWFFVFKQNILSDVPFTFLATGGLWAFLHYDQGHSRRGAWLALFLVFMATALLVRSAGVALLGAALLYLVFKRRAWGLALLTAGVGGAVFFAQKLMAASTGGYFLLFHDPVFYFTRLGGMLPAKLAKVLGFYFPLFRGGHWLLAGLEAACALALICLAAWGWLKLRRRQDGWDVIDAFVLLYMVMILLWPFNEGPRFYAPVAGLLLIYFLQGLLNFFETSWRPKRLAPKALLNWLLVAGLALNLFNTAVLLDYSGDAYLRPADKQLYAWMKQNLRPKDHYLYVNPRVLALFSGRLGDKYYWSETLAQQKPRLGQRGLDWLILRNVEDQKALAAAKRDPELKLIWANQAFSVFRLQAGKRASGKS